MGFYKCPNEEERMSEKLFYLVVPAGWVEGISTTSKQSLIVSRHQNFDVVVALILKCKHILENILTMKLNHRV